MSTHGLQVDCFNGAALLRARSLYPVAGACGFNGAALLRARSFLTGWSEGASMGPRVTSAELLARRPRRSFRVRCTPGFNGAAAVKARSFEARPPLRWGRADRPRIHSAELRAASRGRGVKRRSGGQPRRGAADTSPRFARHARRRSFNGAALLRARSCSAAGGSTGAG